MRPSVTALISSLAFASANPIIQDQDRPAMANNHVANSTSSLSRSGLKSRQTDSVSAWAGSVQQGSGWTFVTGTSVVPSVRHQGNTGAATWVGIDGETCGDAILQTGFTTWGDGTVQTWYEWWPHPSETYRDVGAEAGDTIRMSVWAYDTRSGKVLLENLTSGRSGHRLFTDMEPALCLTEAEWIVEQFTDAGTGGHVYLADFGTIDITDTQAEGTRGTVGADGGHIVEIHHGGQPITSCGTNQQGVKCQYLG